MTDFQTALFLRRHFAAPRERVFRAWTEPKLLEQWFRPMGNRTTVSTLDLRVGGAYRFELAYANGGSSYIAGNYVEISPPAKLVFTWQTDSTHGAETLVTLEFVERAGGTEVRLTHERLADAAMVQMHKHGWESCIDSIAEALAVAP